MASLFLFCSCHATWQTRHGLYNWKGEKVDTTKAIINENNRINLRAATYHQNSANRRSRINSSSKYLGVNWREDCKKWRAQIQENGKNKNLGVFINESDAAKAYDIAAKDIHGEFANINFKNWQGQRVDTVKGHALPSNMKQQ